ncbi:o-succinylbenzoate synthase [Rhodococcus aerolatus]
MDLPALPELLADLAVVALPMRVRFRGITVRETALLRGPAGWGEFGPFPEYDDAEAAWWLASALESAWLPFPAPVRDAVTVNATVPAVPADEVAAVLARFPGAATAKVKVAERGQTLDDDVARVEAVRAAVPRVRVDANGGWSLEEAVTALDRLGELEYAEQPCASVEELAALRRRTSTPVAADESIRRATDPLRVARAGAADVAVCKVAPLGGVRRLLAVAEQIGLPVVVSSAVDSAVGISAGVAAAAALPRLGHACGLGTRGLMAADVADDLPAAPSTLTPGRVAPDPDRLTAHAADAERTGWWRERLTRCHALLAAGHPAWPPPGT